jgi:hypothetical protein
MEDTGKEAVSESKVNLIIGIVVVVAVIVMIMTEVSRVNKDNNTSRKGTTTNTK